MSVIHHLADSQLDELNDSEVASLKNTIWNEYTENSHRIFTDRSPINIVSEGDSWFNYSIAGFDIIDFLADIDDFSIVRHATPGDTLENMVYGTDFKSRSFALIPPQFNDVLSDIELYRPRFFLFSGGGNDIAGPELESLLNHSSTGLPSLRLAQLDFLVRTTFRETYKFMLDKVWSIDPTVHIISHGYANSIPTGKGVGRILGFNFAGPWLKPALTKKRILNTAEQIAIITTLISSFNEMLSELENEYANFHAIDFRPEFFENDWANELHLKNSSFRRAASIFEERIRSILSTS